MASRSRSNRGHEVSDPCCLLANHPKAGGAVNAGLGLGTPPSVSSCYVIARRVSWWKGLTQGTTGDTEDHTNYW